MRGTIWRAIALAAVGALAIAATPIGTVAGTSVHVAILSVDDVPNVMEFAIDFGDRQECEVAYGHWTAPKRAGIQDVTVFDYGDGYGWSVSGGGWYASTLGWSTETVTGSTTFNGSGSINYGAGEFEGRAGLTVLIDSPGPGFADDFLPASFALDILCPNEVTVTARSGQTLRLLPDQDAPVAARGIVADAEVLADWGVTVEEPEGRIFAGGFGEQFGTVDLATPTESASFLLPQINFTNLAGGAGTYEVDVTRVAPGGFLWVAVHGIAGPFDLTPHLVDERTIPDFRDLF